MGVLKASSGITHELWFTENAILLVDTLRPRTLVTYVVCICLFAFFASPWFIFFVQFDIGPVAVMVIFIGAVMAASYAVLELLLRSRARHLASVPLQQVIDSSTQIPWDSVSKVDLFGDRLIVRTQDSASYSARAKSDVEPLRLFLVSKVGERVEVRRGTDRSTDQRSGRSD